MKELVFVLIITFALVFVILAYTNNPYASSATSSMTPVNSPASPSQEKFTNKMSSIISTRNSDRAASSVLPTTENSITNSTTNSAIIPTADPNMELTPTPRNDMKYYSQNNGETSKEPLMDMTNKITSNMANMMGSHISQHLKFISDLPSSLDTKLDTKLDTNSDSNHKHLQEQVSRSQPSTVLKPAANNIQAKIFSDIMPDNSSNNSSENASDNSSDNLSDNASDNLSSNSSESLFENPAEMSPKITLHNLQEIHKTTQSIGIPIGEQAIPKLNNISSNENSFKESGEQCQISKARCSVDHCGTENLHPILDPQYNMREAAKQCVLLEDHLNNTKKRCFDCIRKHFLIVDGFLEEAVSLEKDNNLRNMYRSLYLNWVKIEKQYAKNPKNSTVLDEISKQIRAFRKPLVEKYFDTVSQYDD
jgi:hypothetical protein